MGKYSSSLSCVLNHYRCCKGHFLQGYIYLYRSFYFLCWFFFFLSHKYYRNAYLLFPCVKALVDGPCSDVRRKDINFKALQLTPFTVKIGPSARSKAVRKAWEAADISNKWAQTSWAKKLDRDAKVSRYLKIIHRNNRIPQDHSLLSLTTLKNKNKTLPLSYGNFNPCWGYHNSTVRKAWQSTRGS